jgi:hypothetical protein
MHEAGDARQRHEVVLDILARGEVPAATPEFIGYAAQLLRLGRGQQAAGDLASHHLDAGLPLAVNAVFQPEGAKLIFCNLASEVCLGSFAEGFDLLANYAIMFNFKLFTTGEGLGHSGVHNHPLAW